MTPIIEVKNIGKKYNIAHQQGSYVALRDVITNILKSPFSFATRKAQQVTGFAKKEEFWALRNVNFNVEPGEVVGIIGHNGAGKSTMLKILTGITPPSEGEIILKGRVSSLLEVGTGFHPELTGRENIFLNGAILGMSRTQIAKNFNAIVEFAGIEKFLDTPVKYYSSGMYVRLAFSVAAHMEPDILLVDEVLAVGDAEFQKKCLGKMEEITTQSGRTIIFVSHNLSAIQRLCKKCILLEKGTVKMYGDTKDVIDYYVQSSSTPASVEPHKTARELKINSITSQQKGQTPWAFTYGEEIALEVALETYADIPHFQLGIGVNSLNGERIVSVHSDPHDLKKGAYTIQVKLKNIFAPGTYEFGLDVLNVFFLPGFTTFHIIEDSANPEGHNLINPGFIDLPAQFSFK